MSGTRYVVARVMGGHWHYYVKRNHWDSNVGNAYLMTDLKEAWAHIYLLPDGDEVSAVVLLANITVGDTVDPKLQESR